MKSLKKIALLIIIVAGITATGTCQLRLAVPVHTTMYNALNAPSMQQNTNKVLATNSKGTFLPAAMASATFAMTPCGSGNCQDIAMKYEVPGFVMLDRILLAGNIRSKMGTLMDEQLTWQNMSSSQASDQTKQQMNTLLQNQIDQLQGIADNMANGCVTVDFKNYTTHVDADVRYNDPVSGSMGLMLANGSGDVDVTQLFNGIPFSALEANPVRAKLLIYKK